MVGNPLTQARIVTRPARDVRGPRERIGKNVLNLLSVGSKGGLRTSDTVHSRLLIIDERQVIVSTADLTRDQLFDEFNAGLLTSEPKCVQAAIEYFENLWAEAEPL